MPRGRKIIKQIELEECSLGYASEEFYRHNRAKGLAKETQEAYKIYVGGFVKVYGEDLPLLDISSRLLEDYMFLLSERGNKPVSVATNMKHLRRFFNFCVSRTYMDAIEVTIPKYDKELKEPYTDEEMCSLLKKPRTHSWAEYRTWVMVNYFFSTGQRLSTVLNIKVSHLDLDNARVMLEWNKDKIQKYMPLSSALVKVLKEYIEASDLKSQDYLFPEYEGKQFSRRGAEDAIKRYNTSRGINKTSIHLFRHTFAKNYILNGGSPAKLQKLLNHKTIEMTMHYVNLYSEDISTDMDLYNPLDNLRKGKLAVGF